MYTFSESSWNGPEAGSDQLGQSLQLYTGTILKGKIIRMLGYLTRNPAHLVDLGTFARSVRVGSRHYAGIQSIKISSIRGSEAKVEDFDCAFNPMHERIRGRWLNVAKARLSRVELPPVELIQVDQIYFVRDGHHRISVARALGENYIDAEVTQWEVEPLADWEVGRNNVQDEGYRVCGEGARILVGWSAGRAAGCRIG